MRLLSILVTEHNHVLVARAIVADGFETCVYRRMSGDMLNDAIEARKIVEQLAQDLQSLEIEVTAEDVERAIGGIK